MRKHTTLIFTQRHQLMQSKKSLSEEDICAKFITPAVIAAGWDEMTQIRRQVYFTDGRIIVRGKLTSRGQRKFADYILYFKTNIPIAVIEAKDNSKSVGAGMQQGLGYAETLDIPFVFSSNGDGFIFHNKAAEEGEDMEAELSLEDFPSPTELWQRYKKYKNISDAEEAVILQDYYLDRSGRSPRYYQTIAINRTVQAVVQGQNRALLVMATGTGKTYTAFNIIYRLWKSGLKKRILFLADRTALIDQTRRGDFRHFKGKMTVIKKKVVEVENEKTGKREEKLVSNNKRGIDSADKAYEIFLGLYQGLTNSEGPDAFRDFSPDFFDLIVIDECHRGSAKEDSAWREILRYFSSATHIGLTATPKETKYTSNIEYFGDPIYTYSLRQGISDGFLAPYKVVRVGLNVDLEDWRPESGKRDKSGNLVPDRIYNKLDYDRNLVIDERTLTVARKVDEFLRGTNRMNKTIIFCVDIDHAERMRRALVNLNQDLMREDKRYVMRMTGDNPEGKAELDNFTNPEEDFPVIVTTSKLLTTGVDAKTCKLIVLDANIQSLTEFKQIIGRGTRIDEEYGKLYFTIIDFRSATDIFADPDFDGDPVRIKEVNEDEDIGDVDNEGEEDDIPEEENDDIPEDETDETETGTTSGLPPRGTVGGDPIIKIHVNGVQVEVLVERKMYFDSQGKPVTTDLTVYTKNKITEQYQNLNSFLKRWNAADKKTVVIEELKNQGIMVDELKEAVNREVDIFDLICHIAYDMPALTRKERANEVKKRNYFTKYGEEARKVLEILLEKYAEDGLENLEDFKVLKVRPFDKFGSALEIVNGIFGGKEGYLTAVKELEEEIYRTTG